MSSRSADDARALAGPNEIRRNHRRAAVVTHGGVVRATLAAWLSMPDEAISRPRASRQRRCCC
jgi:broad specificity phosphatase PhoE